MLPSIHSLGSRELMSALRKQGFIVGRYKTRTIMRKPGLVVRQRIAYKVTTKRDKQHIERFFGGLKHDWILKVHHATTDEMAADVAAYIRYYNVKILHTANGSMSPIEYENYQLKVSTWT